MSIIKHEIPILEFDTEKTAVLNPTHEKLDLKLPKKCVYAFLGDYIETYAKKRRVAAPNCRRIAVCSDLALGSTAELI